MAGKRKSNSKRALPLPRAMECRVVVAGGAYVARALGASVTCTWSDAQAVRGLAKALGYQRQVDVRLVSRDDHGATWQIVDVDAPRSCRVCGCTDGLACRGGCSWVASDLCSACVGAEP